MKVLFINNTIFTSGGVERVLTVLATELAKDNDVTILSYDKPSSVDRNLYSLSNSVHLVLWKDDYKKCYLRRALHKLNQLTGILKKIGSSSLYDWTYIPKKIQQKWFRFINQNEFDVVCGVQANNAIILGKISDKLSCKTIGWQHSSYEAYLETKGFYYYNQDFLFEHYVRKLNHYVVLNEHDEMMFKEKKAINAVTIYNPKSFTSDLKASCMNKRFIACGSFRYVKGFDLLIESFKIFHETNSEWVLDIFGNGPEFSKIQRLIADYDLSDFVFLKGLTNNISKEMISSSALLLSSRWEGMPMVVLEALECGVPVISYNINAIKPLVTNGVEGRIVPAYNTHLFAHAMLDIVDHRDMRCQMGVNASKKAAFFTPEVIGDKWRRIIKD